MRSIRKNFKICLMILLTIVLLFAFNRSAARADQIHHQPRNWHVPEKKIPRPYWKHSLIAIGGVILVAGVLVWLTTSGQDSGPDNDGTTSGDEGSGGTGSETGGFSGSW